MNKSFINLRVETKAKIHLIILVHGYKGTDFDMRLYKNFIA